MNADPARTYRKLTQAEVAGRGSTDAFDLRATVGRDGVGAVQVLPDGEVPAGVDRIEGVVVDEASIERHLLEVVSPERFGGPRVPDDDDRISLVVTPRPSP